MNLRHRDQCIYLVLISILAYMGMYFVEEFTPASEYIANFKFYSHILLILNSFIIYWFSFKYSQQTMIAFIVSALYLASPTHFDAFFFSFGLQALLAETLLLLFFIAYELNHQKKSFILFLLATLGNSKFIALIPFLCFSKKFTLKQKTLFIISFFVQLIYLVPIFNEQKESLLPNFKTIYYIGEVLFFTPGLSFLNLALIIPKYYSVIFYLAGIILIIASGRFFLKKKTDQHLALALLCGTFLSTLIPYKPIFKTGDQFYYFLPTLYPTILLFFMLFALILLKRFEVRKIILVFAGVWCAFWIIADVNFQTSNAEMLRAWDNSMYLLPKDFNFEEKIKLKYANILMEKNEDQRADAFMNLARKKFPHEIWYAMLLTTASKRNDSHAVEQIYKALLDEQIPFNNSAFEDP